MSDNSSANMAADVWPRLWELSAEIWLLLVIRYIEDVADSMKGFIKPVIMDNVTFYLLYFTLIN